MYDEMERKTIASNNYCLWKLRTFGEFFHHFTNIKRTIQTYVCTFFHQYKYTCTNIHILFRMANTTNVVFSCNYILCNGHWNFIAFLVCMCSCTIKPIILRDFNSSTILNNGQWKNIENKPIQIGFFQQN